MAKCAICDKGAHFGNNVSHSHRRSNKMWKSNVKSVRVKTTAGGAKKMYVCTSCLRSGKVERVISYAPVECGGCFFIFKTDKLQAGSMPGAHFPLICKTYDIRIADI